MPGSPASTAPSSRSDPPQDRPVAGEVPPNRIGRALGLIRKLMDYGKELATTLQQRTHTDLAQIGRCFGTPDIALIIASIIRGLHRAAELEARLVTRLGRKNARVGPICAPYLRLPRAAEPAGPRASGAECAATRLTHVPTPRDIAAAFRRRPIGAVIGDICRDLGIVPAHPLWREISSVMLENDGNVGTLLKHIFRRAFVHPDNPPTIGPAGIAAPTVVFPTIEPSWPAPYLPLPAASGAGPP